MTNAVWQPAPGIRTRALIGVYASTAATGLAWGTLVPLMPLILDSQGYSDTAIGINAAMPVLAVLTIGPFMGTILRRVGLTVALYGGIAVVVLALLLLAVPQPYAMSLVLRYLIGMGGGLHWILSETWINTCAPPERRGFFVGIYGSMFTSGFVFGPLLVAVLDINGVWPFVVIAAMVAAAGIVLWSVADSLPPITPSQDMIHWRPLLAAPVLFIGVCAAGLLDSALWALFPLFATGMGATAAYALGLTAILNTGTVGSQMALGLIVDRIGARLMMLMSAAVLVACAALLPFVFATPALLLPVLFVFGATSGSLYTVPMTEMGERFQGAHLAGANALFVMIYSLGGLFGPPISGAAMDFAGPMALSTYIIVIGLVFLAIAVPATLFARRPLVR